MKGSMLTVLIAEDEFVNFFFLKALMEDMDGKHKILHAENGIKAVDLCKDNPDIDLILMDIKMPIMSGFEAMKLIREFRPDIPCIFQTAYATVEAKDEAASIGCCGFITKPINIEVFYDSVNKCIDKKK